MDKMNVIKTHFEEEAKVYDEIIIRIIPFYREMVEALISSIPFNENDKIHVLDLGCGTGTISKEIKLKFPDSIFTIVDISLNMLNIANNKIKSGNITIKNEDFYKFKFTRKYDVIISSLALHHLITDDDKKAFYKKIYDNLNVNGLFFNADAVLGSSGFLQNKYMKKWIEYMNRNCSMDEITGKWLVNYEKEDRPSKLSDQIKWLENIGFKNVDIIWKYYNFAVYGGYKSN